VYERARQPARIGAPFDLGVDGTVEIPEAPGIGVEVDEDFVRAHRVD
jgi:L-alanine-DL-glutamate epimerase-like enolase superfamily enzyme